MTKNRIRDYGINIGILKTGKNNSITDVKGVKVGHCTLNDGDIKTGVTAVIPHEGNIFREKLIAAAHVINGFGKTTGIIQINELGTLETPIILTNTLSVGCASEALVEYMLKNNADIGVTTGTVNPVVCECNDGYLNDIRGMHVKKEHVLESIRSADVLFEEGAVGAGTGMSCYELKGGIGTASRIIEIGNNTYTLGVLVLTNFGLKQDLIVDGTKVGRTIDSSIPKNESEKGSCIIIVATDIPLLHRQLRRVCKRTSIGLGRTGSFMGNGSGEIVIGFSTANKINHYDSEDVMNIKVIRDDKINTVFRAVIESTEEAVLNSLICAETTKGRDGHVRYSLKEYKI
ncbi:P1 family peptidase [Haloimpatiens sp. FM7330]|uniref:DmpA family aminopeptidase n=1 Tax=Haloimpatiens sp. FM7330 TaxID=3298610 RepID=UPI00363B47CA